MPGSGKRGEVLVAIMNNHRDFDILQEQLWYRIPVAKAPKKRWPPQWLAFYHTKVFGDMAYSIQHYGRIREIRVVKRRELFPNEFPSPKSDKKYYQLFLQSLERLDEPIYSARPRRIIFIPTTWLKFTHAEALNDLFDESPLEERLWGELKKQQIPAERQWSLRTGEGWYFLDFAIFCNEGKIAIEADGVSYHNRPQKWSKDRERDNAVGTTGWRVLRFETNKVREALNTYCMRKIGEMINRLGGLADEGLVPRQFLNVSEATAQQLTLFEEDVEYDWD